MGSRFAFRMAAAVIAVALTSGAAAAAPRCAGADGYQAEFAGRRTFLLRPDWLEAIKARGPQDPQVGPAWRAVIKAADEALAGPVYSVTTKTRTPPSGDKHDYMSMGPYWWPDPDKPPGAPYVRRDGRVNPERSSNAFDVTAMERMSGAVESLGLAYFYSGDVRYARKAAELIRVWFLDPATRMNPNANFAQGVPGRTPGRAEGVLDSYRLLRVVESIGLIGPSGAISQSEQAGLERWFGDYLDWMLTSPTGREEAAATNNHGIWFDAQAVRFALFARRPEVARTIVDGFVQRRVATQIEPDGRLPRELTRTRSLHYTVFALQPAAEVAELGKCLGVDLWPAATKDGRSLGRAVRWLASYVGREKDFPYPEISPEATGETFHLLGLAAWGLSDPELGKARAQLALRNPAHISHLTVAPYAGTGGRP